ncbi:MAG TPA: DUF2067 domain-containing protein [Pyrodictium delaneyi]|uniref:DUF2067 domain-containing protein n=1 Tax=Pyrodictium delaneyi TaxID=1273541 RepID=A0A832ZTH2_9CREN|nr:DUF2067 domain-containing protein [Pyrodictium delaneyi]
MGVVKRKLYVANAPPGIPAEKVYEKIGSAIRSSYAEVSIREGKIYIEIVGTDYEIKDSWYRIRQALADLWELYRLRTRREASIEAIVKEAGRTFPPESLVYALTLRGYDARLSEDKSTIYTDAPPEEVIALARKIAEIVDRLRFRVKGTAAKRMIAALASGLNVDPDTVIEYGLRSRVLEETEGGVVLREEWRRGLRKIAVILKGVQLPG